MFDDYIAWFLSLSIVIQSRGALVLDMELFHVEYGITKFYLSFFPFFWLLVRLYSCTGVFGSSGVCGVFLTRFLVVHRMVCLVPRRSIRRRKSASAISPTSSFASLAPIYTYKMIIRIVMPKLKMIFQQRFS